MRTAYAAEITVAAYKHGLDADTLEAQVLVESGGEACAWNPEPRYRYFWNVRARKPFRTVTGAELASKVPPADFPTLAGDPDQEWWAQQASWGLLQIMGAVAREHGLRDPYLTSLCDVTMNLNLGALHLAVLLDWAGGDYARALAAYNGGRGGNERPPFRNQPYADKVFAMRRKLT